MAEVAWISRRKIRQQLYKAVPLSVGLSIVGIPLLAALRGSPREVVLTCSANAALLLIRRLTVDVEELRSSKDPIPLMLNRLLYDRA